MLARARHAAGAGAAGGGRGAARAGAAQLRSDAGAARTSGSCRAPSSTRRRRARQADARVGEIRATIERKTIRAPFSGVLGIRQVNLGQYLSGGDPIVTLQSLNPIYVNFGVPQQAAGQMQSGRTVHVTADGPAGIDCDRPDHGDRLDRRRGDAQRPGAGHARRTRTAAAARHVRADRGRCSAPRSRSCRCRRRRSAMRRTAIRCSSSPT